MSAESAPFLDPVSAPALALPAADEALIGRDADLAAIRALLLGARAGGVARLLTLTGPGGVGKTRLALAAAAGLADRFAAVAVVPLAPVADPAHLLPTVARALGVADGAGGTILARLRDRVRAPHLLVLDNCEHLPAAAPAVAALLVACPALTTLATSRAPFHLSGEREYAVPPWRCRRPATGTPRPIRRPWRGSRRWPSSCAGRRQRGPTSG